MILQFNLKGTVYLEKAKIVRILFHEKDWLDFGHTVSAQFKALRGIHLKVTVLLEEVKMLTFYSVVQVLLIGVRVLE